MRADRWALVLTAAILTACKVGPNFTPPREPVPDQYAGTKAPPSAAAPRTATGSSPSFWWREFHDPELDSLVDAARRGNLDLKGAYLRIVEARIQVQSARAQGLPSLDASASYTREQLGLAGILKSQGINSASGPASSPEAQGLIASLEKPVNLYQLGLRCLLGDRPLRQGAPCGGSRGRAERRRSRFARRSPGVSRGRGCAELFPIAIKPGAAADHAR